MRRIHIFKAGRQTAMSGTTIDFTEADLAATAAAYDPAKHEAPIVVGHPATDDPAYGWVRGLTAQGADLFAEPHEVNPAFAEQVQAKAYKKVSASFYSPQHPSNPTPGVYALRHVGFLGAQPPAVKGLKPIDYADAADCIEIELDFSEEGAAGQTEWKFPSAAAAAAATTPQPTTTETPEPSSLPPGSEAATSGTGVSPEGSTTPPPETTTVTPEEKAALEAQNAQLQADLDAARTTLQAQATAANTAAHTAFAEALIAEARVAPADKALLIATLDHLEPPVLAGSQAQVVEFGEGEAKVPMATALKDWLKALPKRVEFGEQASRDRAAADKDKAGDTVQYAEGTPAESIELDKQIRKYAADNKLSYADAATAVASRR
ncbi:peptidase [Hydrogenophaga taeniospiralis]|uniref:peptidase n=1 Tax=Hydrogenophaga taeniospiralis TaxID=65656 RepID=UPI0021F52F6E|nr:peptidase [Hydrogenophaga taeniospiralis]UCU94009.1 peptidase [Hydrogenophaga taeniospiralis]